MNVQLTGREKYNMINEEKVRTLIEGEDVLEMYRLRHIEYVLEWCVKRNE